MVWHGAPAPIKFSLIRGFFRFSLFANFSKDLSKKTSVNSCEELSHNRGKFMIDYSKLQKALKHLELQFKNLQTLEESQPKLIREAVAESVIQRFETCYDCLWKVLKRYLIEELGLPETPNSPKPVFRIAFENDLLKCGVENWLNYAEARIGTSHDYSGEKALAAIKLMPSFIEDAISLYSIMSKEEWL